ncbi:alpha/beta hydrolase [Lignipirellula cremea]|uniref:Carboxylesterase NlhH n=1 Tax=Lignipirellula cremea TaxID=2528010 RepID=A0A518DVS4_9BACT|nr:alpha/beta hydrolase [Lignipirellula cremea]QDU95934.1 Carboxylesterase NlhH [Lignipirellula cremea]
MKSTFPLRYLAIGLLAFLAAVPPLAAKEPQRDLQYAEAGDVKLRLDLYMPDKTEPAPPLLVWIHGGGWRNGSKDRCPFAFLTGYGYAVASVQYRLTEKASFPAQIHDCKGAVRWLRAHADEYGYNADKIGALGISAGGHLVALLGVSGEMKELEGDVGGNLDQSSRVQAVLDMCGPTDFVLRLKTKPKSVNAPGSSVALLLGGPASENLEAARLASPAQHVTPDDAPLLIFHGADDPTVSPGQSEHLRDQYLQQKLEATLEIIPNAGHVPKEYWDKTRREMMLSFFDRHLKGKTKKPE